MTRQLSQDEAISLARRLVVADGNPAAEEGSEEETRLPPERPREVVGPILGDCSLGKWDALRGRMPADARTARLFVTSTGKRLFFAPDQQPSAGRLIRQRVCHVYEIDMGTHLTRVETKLPCRGDDVFFDAVVELRWRVQDAELAVRSGVTNVGNELMPEITRCLRGVTRTFEVGEVREAEEQALKELTSGDPFGQRFGLHVEIFLTLSMDEPSLVHAALDRKVERMRGIIVKGDYHQFALQLSVREKSITEVMQVLAQERQNSKQVVVEFLTKMLESDAIERWEIEDDLRVLLQSLREWSNGELAGVQETRSTSLGTGRRPIAGGDKR
ncbi:hypothetical protein GCM10011609_02360 [Lentzea pudingi]|uniref:Band 7 domain-containing protein n=1 Tax=Lentzea pudingi TaxID=1789439 RepID=A0ABQ2HAP7_9PSEU|nr:hypothetical protein [Lentzea pudingi]GGM70208.1 hypothetical protein GCM10011609_02360 [Lentzea pudingi]